MYIERPKGKAITQQDTAGQIVMEVKDDSGRLRAVVKVGVLTHPTDRVLVDVERHEDDPRVEFVVR